MNQPTPSKANQRPEFVTLIAIYQFVTAGILFLLSCLIPAIVFPAIFVYIDVSEGVFTALLMATGALALFIGFGFASVVVGWGLLRMREWARMGSIVLGAFALIGFPIWTIVAILVLVYMTSDEARQAFTARAKQQAGDPRHHDALAAQAVYKAEPAPEPATSSLENTRPMPSVRTTPESSGGRVTTPPPVGESHRIEPIPMPPPRDPAEATESFYDDEADVSDHYRRWKSTLEQEPSSRIAPEDETGTPADQVTTEMEIIEPAPEPEEPERKPKRQWVVPAEEAGMDSRILGHRQDQDNDADPGDRQE